MHAAYWIICYGWRQFELGAGISYILLAAGLILYQVSREKNMGIFLLSLELMNSSCYIYYISTNVRFQCVLVLVSSMIIQHLSYFLRSFGRIIYIAQLISILVWLLIEKHEADEVFPDYIGIFIALAGVLILLRRNNMIQQLLIDNQQSDKIWIDVMSIVMDEIEDAVLVLDSFLGVKYSNKSAAQLLRISGDKNINNILESFNYLENSRFYSSESSNINILSDLKHFIHQSSQNSSRLGITIYDNSYLDLKIKRHIQYSTTSFILTAHNITDSYNLKATQAKISSTNQIVATVAHDLRTPTSTIISISDYLLENRSSYSPGVFNKLHLISVCSRIMLNLTNDLLDFFRVISGSLYIQNVCFNIREFLSECMSIISMQCEMKGLNNQLVVRDSLPLMICTDPNRLRQVILNLLSNAVKFTSSGGITLKAKKAVGNVCKISVKDTGIGIPPEDIKKIFLQFGKLDQPELNPYGCGLGLHISNILVNLLGKNDIQVKSIPGQGSKFSFCFDYTDSDSEAPDLSRIRSDSHTFSFDEKVKPLNIPTLMIKRSFSKESGRILIADDNEFSRSIICEFLNEAGIQFTEVSNGLQALEEIRVKNRYYGVYKVVIMDCQMPIMDGWTSSKEIFELQKQGEICYKPVIIAYTADDSICDTQITSSYGINEVLEKPVSKRVFIDTVSKYIKISNLLL
jgi:signal transduction histidine kinase/CheY-like chemotaxis protein